MGMSLAEATELWPMCPAGEVFGRLGSAWPQMTQDGGCCAAHGSKWLGGQCGHTKLMGSELLGSFANQKSNVVLW